MCGIAGYWGQGKKEILDKMVDSISYRGPNDRGVFLHDNVGLGHRRLSILDLSPLGHQPMKNEDGSVYIVFNGEIYNHEDLRKTLKKSHHFNGHSDTEVIIHLYEEVGEKVFGMLQGMFALAIYDIQKGKIYVARDRMGKKPLFWGVYNSTFIFGSELKVLMEHPSFVKEIDPESLNLYFTYEYIPTPHSIFKNTYKLEPGTYIEWDGKGIKKNIFWKPTFLPKVSSFSNSLHQLDKELESAVSTRMVADVPVGIFLSGGIDSSAVAYYAQKVSGTTVKTFSIGFKEASFDESSYARRVAEHLGTDHYEKILSVDDSLKLIPEIYSTLDEPMADSSLVPTYLLSQFTKEKVTVALGGDGGDELFCGYDTFTAHRLSALYSLIPKFIRSYVIEPLLLRLPVSLANMSFDFKVKKFIQGFNGNPAYRNARWLGAFSHSDRMNLFKKNYDDANEYKDVDVYHEQSDSKDFYDMLSLEYQRMYMMDQILVKVDRASMFNSLEVRAPFLDTNVVDLANHMPTSFKFHGLEKKYILKKLMEGKLPHDVIYRKKKGFGLPISQWICGDLKPMVLDCLGRESLDKIGIFNVDYVQNILLDHFEKRRDNRKYIWTLLVFVLWWRKWVQ